MATYVLHTGLEWVSGTTYSVGAVISNDSTLKYVYECTTADGGTSTDKPTHTSGEVVEADGMGWTYIDTYTHTNATTVESASDDPVGDTESHTVKIVKETLANGTRSAIALPSYFAADGSKMSVTYNRTVTGHEYFARSITGAEMVEVAGGLSVQEESYCTYQDLVWDCTSSTGITTDIWNDIDDMTIQRCIFVGDGGSGGISGFFSDRSTHSGITIQLCIGYGLGNGIVYVRMGGYNVYHCTADGCGNSSTFRYGYTCDQSGATTELKNSVGIRFQNGGGDIGSSGNWDTTTDVFTGDATGTDQISETNEEDVFTDADGRDYTVVASSSIDGACAGKVTGIDNDFLGNAFDAAPSAGAVEAAAVGGGATPKGVFGLAIDGPLRRAVY